MFIQAKQCGLSLRPVLLKPHLLSLQLWKTRERRRVGMTNRREVPLMRNTEYSLGKSKVAVAVAAGVFVVCVFLFVYPHGLSVIYPPTANSNCIQAGSSQGKDNAATAGPFGTVKSLRTNPTVIPDVSVNPRLAKILEKIAVRRELIVTLVNSKMKDYLEVWFTSIKRVGIPNYLVVALDDKIANFCESNEVPFYKPDLVGRIDSVARTGVNKDVSGLKFLILRDFLQLGYSVLLSDVDIVYLQNPFDHLYRDCDVESMTDGHNNITAYGYDELFEEPSMGWARNSHSIRIWLYNSGLFYIRPTIPSIELLDRVFGRLSKEPEAWDQLVFNEELFFPSHPGYTGLHASKRTMDFYLFLNSKVLFRTVRKDAKLIKTKPVTVHINYHPDKLARMKAVIEFYMDGNPDALKPFPDGSEW